MPVRHGFGDISLQIFVFLVPVVFVKVIVPLWEECVQVAINCNSCVMDDWGLFLCLWPIFARWWNPLFLHI